MYVERQGREVEEICKRLHSFTEPWRGSYEERVVHGGGRGSRSEGGRGAGRQVQRLLFVFVYNTPGVEERAKWLAVS